MSSHGKWSHAGVPHQGWVCQDVEDNGPGSDFICEMCETQEIRFIHEMVHPVYPEALRCGCICAGNMEGDPGAAVERERRARLMTASRDRWPRRKGWSRSARGNPFLRYQRFVVIVFPLSQVKDQYGFLVKDDLTGRELVRSRKPLPNEFVARQRTFDAVQWLMERQNLRRVMSRAKPP
jgi:hypothetical protein